MVDEAQEEPAANTGTPDKKGTPNPFAHATNITLSVPEAVEVKLVDASALSDYETWIFLASTAWSATSGFVVAAFQAPHDERAQFIAFSAVLIVASITLTLKAFSTRGRLTGSAKKVRFRVGDPVPEDAE